MRVDKSQLGIVSEFGSFLLSWASLVVFRAQSDQRFGTGEYNREPHCTANDEDLCETKSLKVPGKVR